jgi:sugar phosphate isomerase/epimerase
MKVGLYSISCSGVWFNDRPPLTVEEFVDTAKKFGYEGVEIDLKRPHGSPLDLNTERSKQIKGYVESKGLELYAVAANNSFASIIPEHIENELLMVREQIRVAKDLGAPILRVFVAWRGVATREGVATYEPTRVPDYYGALKYQLVQNIVAGLKEISKYAEDAGIVLALQNHEPVLRDYRDMIDYVKWVNSPNLKCSYDCPCEGWSREHQTDEYQRNAVLAVGDLQILTHANAEFIEHSDGTIENYNYTTDHETVPNYPAFVKALKEINYKGYIGFEFCHMPFGTGKVLGYNDYIENQIRLARLYFANLIAK